MSLPNPAHVIKPSISNSIKDIKHEAESVDLLDICIEVMLTIFIIAMVLLIA